MVFIAVQSVPEMTYNVFSGTLNPTHFTIAVQNLVGIDAVVLIICMFFDFAILA